MDSDNRKREGKMREEIRFFVARVGTMDEDDLLEEVEIAFYSRDAIEEMKPWTKKERESLRKAEDVWRSKAGVILKYPEIFDYLENDNWWWKKEVWEELAKKRG